MAKKGFSVRAFYDAYLQRREKAQEEARHKELEKKGEYVSSANSYYWKGRVASHPIKKRLLLEKSGQTYLHDKKNPVLSSYRAAQSFSEAGDHEKAGEAYLRSANNSRAMVDSGPGLWQIGYVWKEDYLTDAAKEFEKAGNYKKAAEIFLELKGNYRASNVDRDIYRNLKKSGQYEKLEELQEAGKLNLESYVTKPHNSHIKKIEEGLARKHGGLEKITAAASVLSIFGGTFFSATKLTGNVIGTSAQTSSIISFGLLAVGIIFGLIWLSMRKKKKAEKETKLRSFKKKKVKKRK